MSNIVLTLLMIAAAPPFEVQTLDGKKLVGPLVEMTAERLSVETEEGRVSLETSQLLSLAAKEKPAPPKVAPGLIVELMDGSVLKAKQYTVQSNQARIAPADGEAVQVATSAVRNVQLQQQAGALATEWSRLVKMKADSDLLVVRKDQTIDYHKGVLNDVTDDTVQFEVDGNLIPVKRSKVYGFAYHHGTAPELPAARCRVTDASGSQWAVRSLKLGEKLEWTTPAGVSASAPADQIAQIDFSGGNVVYLSDLKPDSVAWTPFFGTSKPLPAMEQFYAPRYDRGFESSTLQVGGTKYTKGVALRSRTELVYRLPEQFMRFQAVAGIDDAVRPGGKVRLVVRGDDKVLFDKPVAGGEAPQSIDVDLSGVRRLTVLVDFVGTLNVGDHLLLCNARLNK